MTKNELKENIITVFKEIESNGGKLVNVENIDSATDSEIVKELLHMYYGGLDIIKEDYPNIGEEEIKMVVQGQLEAKFQCTYEDLFSMYIEPYLQDTTKFKEISPFK